MPNALLSVLKSALNIHFRRPKFTASRERFRAMCSATTGEEMLWQQILLEVNDYRRVKGRGGRMANPLVHTSAYTIGLGKKRTECLIHDRYSNRI